MKRGGSIGDKGGESAGKTGATMDTLWADALSPGPQVERRLGGTYWVEQPPHLLRQVAVST